MARTPRNDLAVTDMARAMKKITGAHPDVTPKQVELWIHSTYDHHVSEESIRKAFRGVIDPDQCKVELLTGLCAYFEVSPHDLGKFAERRIMAVRSMVGAGPDDPDGTATQGVLPSGWNDDHAGKVLRPARWAA